MDLKNLPEGFAEFCASYAEAIKPRALPLEAFAIFIDAVKKQLASPYQFLPYHEAVRTPVDYYKLGLDFIRPLIDFDRSTVSGSLQAINEALSKNENVILLANHQTEIDPQVISLLLEKEYPELAEKMIFVAGHRVTTDPLAVPLSLGRNLICIYSKRHIDTPPEKKAEKLTHNQKALKALEEQLNLGGRCIYIAPSGGRDRVDEQGQIQVAPFDPQSVEMFYLLSQKAKCPTHIHSLALATYALLPPPDQVLKEIGEVRKTSYSPAHLWFSPKIDMEHLSGHSDKKERRLERANAIWREVASHYGKFYGS
ncbi:MAG: 1-acyl-sn-glycerol-3-phosphate acyltransferase [Verrucomicrobia bacterium]|nr:1-acyl-sn-glycerol-3-phosphate acyltransferase [Verrucomicrobiota bacterium]MBS0637410.1 1-acyl-sn-glycerol-3-phosphate acyltransferase [Verrucomicrobiota bacterium]